MAESFFSRLRRAEIGIHHHIAGPYLAAYAAEMGWREDRRRIFYFEQFPRRHGRGARPCGEPPMEGLLATLGCVGEPGFTASYLSGRFAKREVFPLPVIKPRRSALSPAQEASKGPAPNAGHPKTASPP